MKMLNDLLHKLAANKANNGFQITKSPFLLKPKSFISPKKGGKVTLLGKRSSLGQQKENAGAQ